VAISILYGELLKEDDRDFTHKDLTKLLESEDEVISEIARTVFYLQSLDEDIATFLQESILEDLGFSTRRYFEPMQKSAFYPHFEKWGNKRFVGYIEDWNNANFKGPQFMKTFLKSLNKIEVERHPKGILD